MTAKFPGIIFILLITALKVHSQSLTIDSVYVTNATSCMVCNGSATASVSGGETPYTFYWSNGETSQPDTNLCAGTYTLSVIDWFGDYTTRLFIIGPSSISLSLSSTSPSACSNIGSVTANVTGGSTPYTYLCSYGGETTASITGLSGGEYSVTVHDN